MSGRRGCRLGRLGEGGRGGGCRQSSDHGALGSVTQTRSFHRPIHIIHLSQLSSSNSLPPSPLPNPQSSRPMAQQRPRPPHAFPSRQRRRRLAPRDLLPRPQSMASTERWVRSCFNHRGTCCPPLARYNSNAAFQCSERRRRPGLPRQRLPSHL